MCVHPDSKLRVMVNGWQQGPESATSEDTLDTLVMHGLINRVYLPFVRSSSILAVHW